MNITKVKKLLKETLSTTFEVQINDLTDRIKQSEDPTKLKKLEDVLKFYSIGVKPISANIYYELKRELEELL